MVVALLALSSVMILGGIAAVVQGFPYVRLESGLAMVIGGSTAASAGVVLLGLTAVVHRLIKIHGSLRGSVAPLRDTAPQPGLPVALPAGAAPWEAATPEAPAFTASEVTPPERPSLAGVSTAGMGAAGLAGLSLGALRPGGRGSEPVFEDPAPPVAVQPNPAEPLLPDLLPEAEPPRASDDDLFRTPEPAPAPVPPEPQPATFASPVAAESEAERIAPATPAVEPIGLRSFLDEPAPAREPALAEEPTAPSEPLPEPALAEPAPETASQEAEPEEATAAEERHAVGSYASGVNTYVMFSDGSIEADTPRGRFTFASLDELKSFVNAGGEEARGAA